MENSVNRVSSMEYIPSRLENVNVDDLFEPFPDEGEDLGAEPVEDDKDDKDDIHQDIGSKIFDFEQDSKQNVPLQQKDYRPNLELELPRSKESVPQPKELDNNPQLHSKWILLQFSIFLAYLWTMYATLFGRLKQREENSLYQETKQKVGSESFTKPPQKSETGDVSTKNNVVSKTISEPQQSDVVSSSEELALVSTAPSNVPNPAEKSESEDEIDDPEESHVLKQLKREARRLEKEKEKLKKLEEEERKAEEEEIQRKLKEEKEEEERMQKEREDALLEEQRAKEEVMKEAKRKIEEQREQIELQKTARSAEQKSNQKAKEEQNIESQNESTEGESEEGSLTSSTGEDMSNELKALRLQQLQKKIKDREKSKSKKVDGAEESEVAAELRQLRLAVRQLMEFQSSQFLASQTSSSLFNSSSITSTFLESPSSFSPATPPPPPPPPPPPASLSCSKTSSSISRSELSSSTAPSTSKVPAKAEQKVIEKFSIEQLEKEIRKYIHEEDDELSPQQIQTVVQAYIDFFNNYSERRKSSTIEENFQESDKQIDTTEDIKEPTSSEDTTAPPNAKSASEEQTEVNGEKCSSDQSITQTTEGDIVVQVQKIEEEKEAWMRKVAREYPFLIMDFHSQPEEAIKIIKTWEKHLFSQLSAAEVEPVRKNKQMEIKRTPLSEIHSNAFNFFEVRKKKEQEKKYSSTTGKQRHMAKTDMISELKSVLKTRKPKSSVIPSTASSN